MAPLRSDRGDRGPGTVFTPSCEDKDEDTLTPPRVPLLDISGKQLANRAS